MHYQQLSLVSLLWGLTSAAPTYLQEAALSIDTEVLESRGKVFPFTRIVAFGDDMTDDGSGSYAHGVTGNTQTGEGAHLWGADTWTDGPVAVTNLANNLGLPLTYNYAFGSAGGGDKIGTVCTNSLLDPTKYDSHAKLLNGKLAPAADDQVRNYTTKNAFNQDIANTLHFFWTGNNDMIASLGWSGRFTICSKDTLCHPGQQTFITQVMGCMENTLGNLLKAGAKHVLVPNVYPRNISPWTSQYISAEPGMIADFGQVIKSFNMQLMALTAKLSKQYNAKVMYFPVNSFLENASADKTMVQGAAYNYTCVDGCPKQIPGGISNWNLYWQNTVLGHKPDDFFWMTTVVPSATVMRAIANKMTNFLNNQY